MNSKRNILLAMETAIDGGSLSLYANCVEIDCWTGNEEVSKAEDILEQIVSLLKKNRIEKNEMGLIKTSKGPGSSTGIKIGLSLAKGLSDALAVEVIEVNAMQTLFQESNSTENILITVLPWGRNSVCLHVFQKTYNNHTKDSSKNIILNLKEFEEYLIAVDFDRISFYQRAYEICGNVINKNPKIKNRSKLIKDNLATMIGRN